MFTFSVLRFNLVVKNTHTNVIEQCCTRLNTIIVGTKMHDDNIHLDTSRARVGGLSSPNIFFLPTQTTIF